MIALELIEVDLPARRAWFSCTPRGAVISVPCTRDQAAALKGHEKKTFRLAIDEPAAEVDAVGGEEG